MDKREILSKIKDQEQRYFAAHILNKLDSVCQYGTVEKTDFLDPAQQVFVLKLASQYGLNKMNCNFFGGFIEAERKVAVFCDLTTQPQYHQERINRFYQVHNNTGDYYQVHDNTDNFYQKTAEIVCVQSKLHINEKQKKQLTLSHRDYLGALMGLGIERSKIGDIILDESGTKSHFFVCAELKSFLTSNFIKVGNFGIELQDIPLNEFDCGAKEQMSESRVTVSSLRLDCVLAAAMRLSRGKAADVIHAAKVSVNWEKCENMARILKAGDVLSVKGFGRIYLIRVDGETKKGRVAIILGALKKP